MPLAHCLFFLCFHLDLTTETLWEGPQRRPLRPKAWALLRYLVEHPQRLISQAELLAAIWQREYVSDGLLRGSIRELRRVLHDEATAPRYIETVSGRGYRFIPAVSATPLPLPVPEVPPQPQRSALRAPEVPPSASTTAILAEEYKLVTILCGALAEAPALAARLGPEGLYRLLHTVVGLAQEVLHPYAGTLTLATSEGFTAVFGAPVAQEDHARRAVLAALDLRQRVQASPALHAQLAGGSLALRMGLHSGLVVVGGLGQDPQPLATPVGAPLHVATRLQQQAASGTILLSAATYALVHADVQAEPCGTLSLDGPSSPAPLYAVQGRRLRQHAGVSGRGPRAVSPFIGRKRELGRLHDHLAAAVAGQGQVVGLVGEPGMGKTRLLTEFYRRLAGQPVTVYVGQCLSYSQATPYLPVRDLLRQVCGCVEGDETSRHTVAVQQRLHASGMTAEEDVALLCQLLDLPVALECLERLSPPARQARTFALLRHLVLHEAQRQPLVLVVENLHWSDPTSDAWLASLGERLGDAAVLLLGTYRPGYHPAWGAHAAVTQVALAPLPVQDSRAVVQAVCGEVPLPEAWLRTLVARAAGNPFFLEELAWHAVEHGRPDMPEAVPETVHAVLAARMDRLPPEAKHLVQTAAVIGTDVPLPLLQAIADMPEAALHQSLAHLQAAEFLYETRLFHEPEYTFKHALTYEVAYNSLLLERRRVLHARLVGALEALAQDRLGEQVERLAHHALRGEVWDRAVTYCQQAGARAWDRAAFREALASFEQALQALAHLPDHSDTRVRALDLRLALGGPLSALGDFERRLTMLCEAEILARALDDRARLGRVLALMASSLMLTGDHDGAIAAGQQALELAATLGESALQEQASYTLGQAYYVSGDFGRAAELLRRNVEAADRESGTSRTDVRIRSQAWLARTLSGLGAFAEGRRHGEEALRLATLEGREEIPVVAHGLLGELYLAQGDLEHAIRVLEPGLALCRASGNRGWLRVIMASLGYAYALQGRLAEGRTLLEEASREDIRTGGLAGHASRVIWLSEVCRLARHGEEAWQHARQALDLARQQKARGNEARALYQLGAVQAHAALPDAAPAEALYQQALVLAEELGMRPLQAHCHRGLGTLYATTGQWEQARAALWTAIEMYQAMDMTFWLPETEAALAQADTR
jgi:class 3 adenylate cyclase/tetratricopeptide (TPR) repeat protein